MIFNNTTDLPDKLIAIAVAHSIQSGVEIDEIVVKNKKPGKFHGQWGWYIHAERKIILVTPRVVNYGWTVTLPYSKAKCRINSRADWLIATMAHELRHAWQFQSGDSDYKTNVVLSEVDAELYEIKKLNEWNVVHGEVVMAASFIKG